MRDGRRRIDEIRRLPADWTDREILVAIAAIGIAIGATVLAILMPSG